MRLVAGTIALTLFTSWATAALADDARDSQPPPAETSAASPRSKFPFRVVRVMPESRQALLYDRERSTHILVEVGQPLDGYRVDTIEDDEVTLSREGAQVVLAAPLHGPRNRARAASEPRAASASTDVAAAPRLPDAPSFAPLDPYGEPVRSASASDPVGEGVRVTSAAGASVDNTALPFGSADGRGQASAVDAGPLPVDNTVRAVRAPDSPSADGGLATAAAMLGLSPEPAAPSAPAASAPAPILDAPAPPASAPTPYDDLPAPAPAAIAPERTASAAPAIAAPAIAAPAIAPSAPPPIAAAPDASTAPAPRPSRKRAPKRTPAKNAHASPSDNAQALADILSADKPGRRAPALSGSAPTAPSPATSPPVAVATSPASPAPAAADSHTDPTAALSTSLSRAEIDASLADFAKLTSALGASFSPAGVVLDRVDDASIFQRAGLRSGDTITAIDGVRLRSIDDAASLYARVATASSITVQLQRGGKPVNLRVAIQ